MFAERGDAMKNVYTLLTLLTILLAGCRTANYDQSVHDQVKANKAVVTKSHEEIWSKGNYDAIPELYTKDFVCHFVIGPEWEGQEGLLAEVSSHRTSFPDWRENIVRLVAEGEFVVSHFRSSGTHLGVFHGLAPTGRKVLIDEIAIYRLKNGKIAEQWGLPDINGMNIQLGIVEPGDPANGDSAIAPSP
jgi:steroid delta-isomerase-like uncharacterized protein